MKKNIVFLLLISYSINIHAQKTKSSNKKYQSLLWEITGKGIKKRSFLFATMHVSNKLAFNLSDTFYNAIKSVDAVAIENNPLTWQQEYNESIFNKMGSLYSIASNNPTSNYITKTSFQFTEPELEFKAALATDPEIVNQFLYRSFSRGADFEEDTYLDMHIFQTGKRLGKNVFGLENFKESEALILKAIEAQASESQRKSRSNEADDDEANNNKSLNEKVQDAYRNGDLDMLDSLNRKEFVSDGFNEYFLYARNKVHADEIARTIQNGQSLFAAVGAAHLPGKRGVIEMLKANGYTLKPIIMGLQLSNQRDAISKITLPVTFKKQYAKDSLFSVETPGELYNFNYASNGQKQWLHADFSNGAYYMVTRVPTNGLLWGKNENAMFKKMDSLLYENIPGKILERNAITNNGYKGFNIINKTRKGDVQRYNIFITPLELIVFKMSGFEEYVKGKEASQFFSSIQLAKSKTQWQNFQPQKGGFNIYVPHTPIENNGNNSLTNSYMAMYTGTEPAKGYECFDEQSGTYINILEKNIMNYEVLEEDTFNLALANESLQATTNLQAPVKRIQSNLKGIPYIETSGKCNDDNNYISRIYLVGTKYYAIITRFKGNSNTANTVLNSFAFSSFPNKKQNVYTDSLLKFTVASSLAPDSLKTTFIKIARTTKATAAKDEKTSKTEEPYWKNTDKLICKSDSSDEEIVVESGEYPKYYTIKDSVSFWKNILETVNSKVGKYNNQYNDFYIKEKKCETIGNKKICDVVYADTNSTQTITAKFILNNARLYTISTFTNSLTPMSKGKADFFESFAPIYDSVTNFSLNTPKGKLFFKDYFSKDSVTSKYARKNIAEVRFVETDLPEIVNAIAKLDSKHKDYFKDKAALIKELSNLKKDSSMPGVLNKLYEKAGDTATFQNECILGLANAETKKSFDYLSNIILNDPPVFEKTSDINDLFWNFKDTLKLTKNILPQLLPLTSLEDYKWQVYNTIAKGLDSNEFKANDYESIYNKIYFDARIELKKLLASDEKLINKKTEENEEAEEETEKYSYNNSSVDDLETYSKLLIPFWDKNQNVPNFFNKLLQSRNAEAKLNTAIVLNNNKKVVNDSVWIAIAKDEKHRVRLFNYLFKNKKENLIPGNIAKQNIFGKSILQNGYDKKDSMVYLNVYLPATVKNKKGNVLFYKYKNGEKDVDWKIALCGLQPENINKVNTDETIIEFTDKVLKTNKSLHEQLAKILKEQLYSLRKSSSRFFGDNNYDISRFFGK